jgi:hypothetical protein
VATVTAKGPAQRADAGEARKDALENALPSSGAETANPELKSWRDVLAIHPAANLFPPMSPDELKVLGEDIKRRELIVPIALSRESPPRLVDGRNRLDAMESAGILGLGVGAVIELVSAGFIVQYPDRKWERLPTKWVDGDPYEYVVSANIRRRHLTAEQKRDLIAELLKAQPEKSNRQIAETVKASHVTVGVVRAQMESTGQVDQLPKTVGKDGKARKKRAAKKPRRTGDDFRKTAKTSAVAKPVPDKTTLEVVAADEQLAILKEFATFVLFTAKSVTVDPKDHDHWKALRGRVKAVLGGAP